MASSEDPDKATNGDRSRATAPAEGEQRSLRAPLANTGRLGAAIYSKLGLSQLL